ncbi:UPF0070 protein YfgM [Buchnera aphidicola (Chaitophorus sp. 3695)]|uniref:hypothetical protein n=1 Tax=Buchnera aphidicola TaxID=9 RepID=UPI003463909D
MDLKRNKIYIYFFVLILFVAGIFYLKNVPLFQKYIRKLDFINYKKTVDYLGKKYSKIFSHHNQNFYNSLNTLNLMKKNLNEKDIYFITTHYQNYLSYVNDADLRNNLSLKFFHMAFQLKNPEYSLQILNYMKQYPWNNISKIYKQNIEKYMYQNNQLNYLYLYNNVSFN